MVPFAFLSLFFCMLPPVTMVDDALLAQAGAVDPGVAEQMAAGVRALTGATYGLATTGVAGPDPADGKPVGTVYVAVVGPGSSRVKALALFRAAEEAVRFASEAARGQ